MFPYWDDVIAPMVQAVDARRVVEIGALRGDTTVRMLEHLGADCELHVVDPVPQFDPAEHEQAFPGRYIFHLGISHDVLPHLPPADVALIDGDHNWFTVYHELRMLAATARAADRPLPLLVLHDVGWPYGRRDLYYEPSRIPVEFRHPHRRAGMRPGISGLRPLGGMNLELHNAEHEGGPRNGVLTALEDFVAEHDRALRVVILRPYYGLAIVAEEERLAARPGLRAMLDRLDTIDGQRDLVTLGESIRIDEAITTQAWLRYMDQRLEQGRGRYLSLIKAALLDEHYIDNEVRLDHLSRLLGQANPDLSPLRDPARLLRAQHQRVTQARAAGRSLDSERNVAHFPYTDMGHLQLDGLESALDRLREQEIPGDLLEVGVGRGGGGMFLSAYLAAHEDATRQVWMLDRFLATLPDDDGSAGSSATRRFGADLHQVRDGFERFGLLGDNVRFIQDAPTSGIAGSESGPFALVRLGEGLGVDVGPVLDTVIPRLSRGAEVVVSGVAEPTVADAVTAARMRAGVSTPVVSIDWNSLTWTMPLEPPGDDEREPSTDETVRLRLEPSPPTDSVALSVVVVFYNMAREAERTLRSLSRSFQLDIEDLTYEVIAVDNGSDPDQRLTAEQVASYGPEFHLLDMAGVADQSPTSALNAGVALSSGEHVALMIDGAHVLTPGVLHHGMLALHAYSPAVVATQQWYVGPGQQDETLHEGYDQAAEDRLFRRIQWPTDGYRLFEIGHFIGERDWFDGIVESNCVFMPVKLLEQVGGVDQRFSMPGGGYANLDLFERLALAPGVTAASILGEGTFHQFHGGTTTNVTDDETRRGRVASYREHFVELRGRALLGLDRPIRFVGALEPSAAKRTRPRRAFAALDALRDPVDHDADAPARAMADELKLAAIEALWDQRAWKEATWLGHRVNRFPTDLHCYQELLIENPAEVVVVTGDDDGLGGRGLYMASILDHLGHGRVITVGRGRADARPEHPRLQHVEGAPDADTVAAEVISIAVSGPAMVLLALGQDDRVVKAFGHYAPLVYVGGYVIVENTVVNGRPAAPGFGPGPLEAVFKILADNPEFISDHRLERYSVTFNRSGFLRRLEVS